MTAGKFTLLKAVIETRYMQTALFHDMQRMQSIIKALNKDFQSIHHSPGQALILFNPEERKTIGTYPDRVAFDIDEPELNERESVNPYFTNVSSWIEMISNELSIDTFNRFGLRLFFLFEMDSAEAGREKLINTFFLPIKEYDPVQTTVSFTTNKEDLTFTFNINAITSFSLFSQINYESGQHTQENRNRKGILYDIDVYVQGELTLSQLPTFQLNAYNQAMKFADEFNVLVQSR